MTNSPQSISLPNSWKRTPLKELGEWCGGGTPSKAKPRYWENGIIPWVSPKDMKKERITDSEDRITEIAVSESTTNLVPAGSVLIVTRSGILRHTLPVAVANVPVTVNQDLKVLAPKSDVLPEYVAWGLRAFSQDILHTCSKQGTTVNSIETQRLLDYEIPLAPPEQQKAIVAEIEKQFSRLDEAVANLKRVKANLKRYKAAVLKAAVEGKLTEEWRKAHPDVEPASELLKRILAERRAKWNGKGKYKEPKAPHIAASGSLPEGWTSATVEQVSSVVQYGSSVKTSEDPTGIPVLRMGNIADGKLRFADLKYLPESHEEFPELLLDPGDVLFNRTNSAELVGKTAVYQGNPRLCSFASYLIRARLLNGYLPEFFAYYINSVFGRAWIASVVTQQVGQANVNGTKLQALIIPLPCFEEQQQIVAEVERRFSIIEELEAEVGADLQRSERFRQSLLQQAFQGQLVKKEATGKLKGSGVLCTHNPQGT
jgi:type I restriction enzyme S subunit